MLKKHEHQIQKLKAGLTQLQTKISLCQSYEEISQEMKLFSKYFQMQANPKNNIPNKEIMGVIKYLDNTSQKARSIEVVQAKAKVKKLTPKKSYKDYFSEYRTLRLRGYSYQKIADYSNQYFKTPVSKNTIRKLLNEKGEKDASQ